MAYNPLEISELGGSVARALEEQQALPLGEIPSFTGVGVYALYYTGSFAPYRPLAKVNAGGPSYPIYVGKAVSRGARMGETGFENADSGTDLRDRLRNNHRRSIESATNLNVGDFLVRWLVVTAVWVPLGESVLIRRYRPLWNSCVDGFGNNDPGSGRRGQERSEWDTLHPGREWARVLATPKTTAKQLEASVKDHLAGTIGKPIR